MASPDADLIHPPHEVAVLKCKNRYGSKVNVLYRPSSPSKLTKHLDVPSVGLKRTIADYVPCVTLPVAPSNELFMDGV
jgi:hypothetical protein